MAAWDYTITQGQTIDLPMTLRDKATGTPTDLTGASFTYRVRINGTVTSFNVQIVDAVNGQICLHVPAADTLQFEPTHRDLGKPHTHQLWVHWANGNESPMASGTLTIERGDHDAGN